MTTCIKDYYRVLFFISLGFLFAQSKKPSVPANDNNERKAGRSDKSTAQDFNTTRSNRQNSNLVIISVGGSQLISKEQEKLLNQTVNRKEYTDEWSTAVIVVNPNHNDTTPTNNPHAISTAQDFNTTRSNRQNSSCNSKIIINGGGNTIRVNISLLLSAKTSLTWKKTLPGRCRMVRPLIIKYSWICLMKKRLKDYNQ